MKILAIDDQQIVLLFLEKRLSKLGYEVRTAKSGHMGITIFAEFKPDLVMVDINMPGISGLSVVEYLRMKEKSEVPIIVMSGNTDEDVMMDAFDKGVDDYVKKPVGLNEVSARIKQLIGEPQGIPDEGVSGFESNQVIQEHVVAVVIPCYNEEKRLMGEDFKNFVHQNLGYHLCFVNDGSTDRTLEVLQSLKKGYESNISIYNCPENVGKAEAVRQGTLHLAADSEIDYIGYLDADLSTDLEDFKDLVKTLRNSEYRIVSGSRMARMGAAINKESSRAIISKTINFLIRAILGMPFNDTQCGAKIMDRELAILVFGKPFLTRWLFDVEIFKRIGNGFGRKEALAIICERPLRRWIHADGSKLSFRDSLKIVFQLAQIAFHYTIGKHATQREQTQGGTVLSNQQGQVASKSM